VFLDDVGGVLVHDFGEEVEIGTCQVRTQKMLEMRVMETPMRRAS
jgi:hypothetical protein